jgi:hypothetical protein
VHILPYHNHFVVGLKVAILELWLELIPANCSIPDVDGDVAFDEYVIVFAVIAHRKLNHRLEGPEDDRFKGLNVRSLDRHVINLQVVVQC